jgi:hypothetical protein
MRPGQQNNGSNSNNNNNNNKNRSRGRNNNNGGRKHLNPLSRNYESNGPDVKVRGNAAHITEKYQQLARDAHASGDSVMAENYLQHAEHYFRIVAAAQPQGMPRTDQFGQDFDGDDGDGDDAGPGGEGMEQADRFDMPQQYRSQNERPFNDNRQPRDDRPRDDRPRDDRPRDDRPRDERPVRPDQPVAVRSDPPATGEVQESVAEASSEPASQGDEEPRRVRERRPRRRRPAGGDGGVDPSGPQPDLGELPAFITAGGGPNVAE